MSFNGDCFPGSFLSIVKILVIIFLVFPGFCLWGACEKEEKQEVQMEKVIVRMKIPPPEPSPAREKAGSESGEKDVIGTIQPRAVEQKKLSSSAQVEKLEKQMEMKEKRVSSLTQAVPLEKKQQGLASEIPKAGKEMAKETRKGYYKVRKGDTLSKIAGRKDVYGDPIKWPSLFRLNMDKLKGMEETGEFYAQELPQGLDLKFMTSQETAENISRLGQDVWVVNVLSSPLTDKIVPAAVKLMKHGHRVYITRVMVKGTEWMRLRTGFYNKRSKADDAGKEIKPMLNVDDAWVVRIGQEELEEFGGY